jgi:hypothetical protein
MNDANRGPCAVRTSEVVVTLSLHNTCTYIPESLGANAYVKNSNPFWVDCKTAFLQFMLITSWAVGVNTQHFVGRKAINMTTTFV